MWRKLLKFRDMAKQMHRVKVGTGNTVSFWHDQWHELGRLHDLLGPRGIIDLGVPSQATVAEALEKRPRRHRSELLKQIEASLQLMRTRRADVQDTHLWLSSGELYKPWFSSKHTLGNIRVQGEVVQWYRCVWFNNSTPKYSFMLWLALINRLATTDRIALWNPHISTACVLCNSANESVAHLFFECSYSSSIWHALVAKIMGARYSISWSSLISALSFTIHSATHTFLTRTSLQVALHFIWCERNARKHGKPPVNYTVLYRLVEKTIRNILEGLRRSGNLKLKNSLRLWLAMR